MVVRMGVSPPGITEAKIRKVKIMTKIQFPPFGQSAPADRVTYVREVNMDKVTCNWCYGVAAPWKIIDSLGWTDYACTVHGTEWFPQLFPESDTTPLVDIVWPYGEGRPNPIGVDTPDTPVPWYPIMSHRKGLRMNDPVTLASAFSILALEGRTAHLSPKSAPIGDQGPWA